MCLSGCVDEYIQYCCDDGGGGKLISYKIDINIYNKSSMTL